MVDSGQFQLYSKIEPPLKAGLYRFTTRQRLRASGPSGALDENALPVEPLQTHVRVRSPQYVLPPDQVLSTFPPAGREGSFGARLPQVVLRRRTLPWERFVDDDHPDEPWLALVLIAQGEGELLLNEKVESCVTPGVELDPPADSEQGNCLAVRRSVVHRIFPTQEEVRLLAHARAVDIDDTELMMGDDDGYLAVVISNRLPLPARDDDGDEVPTTYLACLVNLCGQWDSLLDKAPEPPQPVVSTFVPQMLQMTTMSLADVDHATMHLDPTTPVSGLLPTERTPGTRTSLPDVSVEPTGAAPYAGAGGWAATGNVMDVSNIYTQLAAPFATAISQGFVVGAVVDFDPQLRFPVLLHWSFTSVGDETFESIMADLDSGLLGTLGTQPTKPGRPPLEVVETGHTGLGHRLRSGDRVRSWYRSPFVPHPTVDDPAARLPLAHTADQLRTVVPDRREDISLAAAFEIGRLLGLSRPSVVTALLRWRQGGYQVAHRAGMVAGSPISEALLGLHVQIDRDLGNHLGALLADSLVKKPSGVLGDPSPLAAAGRPVLEDRSVNEVMAAGLGIDPEVFRGGPEVVLERLTGAEVLLPVAEEVTLTPSKLRAALAPRLDTDFTRVVVQALAPQIREGTIEVSGIAELLPDLHLQLADALVPSVVDLRRRLDLDVDLAAVPKNADALDVLMRARPEPEEEP